MMLQYREMSLLQEHLINDKMIIVFVSKTMNAVNRLYRPV